MSETNDLNSENSHSKVIQFPIPSDGGVFSPSTRYLNEDFELPQFRKITLEAEDLDKKSKYKCDFDYSIYKSIELRYQDRPIRGGIAKKAPMKLVNSHASCQQCWA